jgi:hypothetical protein
MDYKDATKQRVRIDKVRRQGDRKVVDLSASRLVPDMEPRPRTGTSWLKAKVGGDGD